MRLAREFSLCYPPIAGEDEKLRALPQSRQPWFQKERTRKKARKK